MVSDGLNCFKVAATAGAVHDREITDGGKASVLNDKFHAVDTFIGHVTTALIGTRTTPSSLPKCAYRDLAGVQFRFNRRDDLVASLFGLLTALVHAPRWSERGHQGC